VKLGRCRMLSKLKIRLKSFEYVFEGIIIWNLRYAYFSTWLLQLHMACFTDQRKLVIVQYSLISHCDAPSIIIGDFKNMLR
jgi:hypothetical protein